MGLISKIKAGLNHDDDVAATQVAAASASSKAVAPEEVAVKETAKVEKAAVVQEATVVDVPINTHVAEADVTVVQAPTEEVQVKQAEAIVQEKKDIHEEIEVPLLLRLDE